MAAGAAAARAGAAAQRGSGSDRSDPAVAAAQGQARCFPPIEIVSADEIEAIHQASLTRARRDRHGFHAARGARPAAEGRAPRIEGERVRFRPRHDRGSDHLRAVATSRFHARNPRQHHRDRRRHRWSSAPSAARPTAPMSISGRRTGNHADYRNFLRLAQYFNCIGFISRLSGRADRPPCLDPPSRGVARHGRPHRQAVPRLFAGPGAHLRRHRDRPHRPRHRR